jgi:hypothetical protein
VSRGMILTGPHDLGMETTAAFVQDPGPQGAPEAPRPRLLNAFLRAKTSRLGPIFAHEVSPARRPLPRIVWMLWDRGEAAAPPVVRHCIATWRDRNPGWEVRVLDAAALDAHPDLRADLPRIGITKASNRLRNRLLVAHGGVWADATTLCAAPLDHWLPMLMEAGLFCFARPAPDRLIANWFIAAEPANPLLQEIDAAYEAYWRRPGGRLPYFGYHYTVEYLWRTRRGFRRGFQRMPCVSAVEGHRLQVWLRDRNGAAPDLTGIPVHKLDWRLEVDPAELRRLVP